ncbi:transporter suffix domain-containing protein [Flammeovirga sp. SubArs3]|uniref:transporter suffix domain-containing protein n=1 Tax=Flammeovirga sp. SubArs3 TaxID=2995316 RepID=UPI00248D0D0C|nr:transporter suffix domain-containing protein [Flammeovirga sp. SubArs3]
MKTSLKSKIGLGFIILGFICPVFGLIVPLLGFSSTVTAALVTFFLVGGPEILFVLGGILAGKEGIQLVKGKVKKLFGLPEENYPATSAQYKLGVVCIVIWFILLVIPGYIPNLFEMPFIRENLLYLSIGTDIMFIVGVFVLGGNQMITKIGDVIKWQPWQLPLKK